MACQASATQASSHPSYVANYRSRLHRKPAPGLRQQQRLRRLVHLHEHLPCAVFPERMPAPCIHPRPDRWYVRGSHCSLLLDFTSSLSQSVSSGHAAKPYIAAARLTASISPTSPSHSCPITSRSACPRQPPWAPMVCCCIHNIALDCQSNTLLSPPTVGFIGLCGGLGYTGPTVCNTGLKCTTIPMIPGNMAICLPSFITIPSFT